MSFKISQSFGDSSGPTYSGITVVPNGVLGVSGANNAIQIGSGGVAVAIPFNTSVVAACTPACTTSDITIYAGTVPYANIVSFGIVCNLVNQSGANTPQNFVKFKGGIVGGHDVIVPIQPGQVVTWNTPATVSTLGAGNVLANGVAFNSNVTSITVTPDVASNTSIAMTIELTE